MKTIFVVLLLALITPTAYAYCDIGDGLIEPRYYEGNLLIMNEGGIAYSIFSDSYYLGTIKSNQGMYVNESLNYSLYASYNEFNEMRTVAYVEKKFNQWWFVILITGIIILAFWLIIRSGRR